MEKKKGKKIIIIGYGSSASLDAIKHVNSLNLNPVIINGFNFRKCGASNIKERNGYKVCFDCGEHH